MKLLQVTLSRTQTATLTVAVPDDFDPDDLFAIEHEPVLAEAVDPLDCDAPAFEVEAVTLATDQSGFIDLDWSECAPGAHDPNQPLLFPEPHP